ncbi:MAG: TIGR02996 domain-containing protein [Isosphaerales bacterium]
MNQDEAFIGDILAAARDDSPRLAYAGWLDQRGDARGNYLRTEMQWAQAREARLEAELGELATNLDAVWVARVSRPPVGVCADHLEFCEPESGTIRPKLTAADLDWIQNGLRPGPREGDQGRRRGGPPPLARRGWGPERALSRPAPHFVRADPRPSRVSPRTPGPRGQTLGRASHGGRPQRLLDSTSVGSLRRARISGRAEAGAEPCRRVGRAATRRGEAHRAGCGDRWATRCRASFDPPYIPLRLCRVRN